jgi:RNA polymerase sigma-70 factor (ECF subfamily)
MNRLEHSDTAELITRSSSGDPDAIESLVHTYTSTVYRLAVSMLYDAAEAEEATQDTLLLVIKRLPSYRGEASFTTWLYAVTLNVCRDRLRKRRAHKRLTQVLQVLLRVKHETHEQIEQRVIEHEADAAVWEAIKALPDKEREVVVLRYYHQLRQDCIAQILGVSDRTVRTRLSAAHTALRTALQGKVDWV